MATASQTRPMTAAEFLAADLGEGRFELVRGEVIEVPPPRPDHGRVVSRAGFNLESYGRNTGFGYCLTESAVGTEIGPDTVRGPDLSFYSHVRWPEHRVGAGLPPVPPDLAVEVLSPSNRRATIYRKVGEYLDAGVLMVWVINPRRRQVTIYRPSEDEVVVRDGEFVENLPELPGFRCAVSDFFPPAPTQ